MIFFVSYNLMAICNVVKEANSAIFPLYLFPNVAKYLSNRLKLTATTSRDRSKLYCMKKKSVD